VELSVIVIDIIAIISTKVTHFDTRYLLKGTFVRITHGNAFVSAADNRRREAMFWGRLSDRPCVRSLTPILRNILSEQISEKLCTYICHVSTEITEKIYFSNMIRVIEERPF